MAITAKDATSLASLLPDGMRCDNNRERLLCIVEMLRCLTDRDHVLSNADIRAVLRAYFGDGCSAAENTIGADLDAIESSGCLDLGLHRTPSGVWCERKRLTPAKVRLLLNAVQSSHSLTKEQSYDLQENLQDLMSRHQDYVITDQVLVDQRGARSEQKVFATVDTAARAMSQGRKIEFEYTFTHFSGKPHALPGDDDRTWRCETPVAIYYSEGNYYVETYTDTPWRHDNKLTRSRADRMMGTRVSKEPADGSRATYDAKRSARKRLEQGFEMVDGEQRMVFLRVKSCASNMIFDRFGFKTRFEQYDPESDDPDATALTLVTICQAFTFYRWLSSFGEKVVIAKPPSEMELRSGSWKKRLEGVSRERLLEDYDCLVRGFLEYLDEARAPYGEYEHGNG
ncbi:MAG: WYL domain-containing protein [Olsenella sp.]|nr:WYL domain-containing protein [Olsenella sp.]